MARLPCTKRAKCTTENAGNAGGALKSVKKTGRKINSPPGLELGVVAPKRFGTVKEVSGLMPFLLCCFFLCCFFLCHRLIPPFQPQCAESGEELGMSSLKCVQ